MFHTTLLVRLKNILQNIYHFSDLNKTKSQIFWAWGFCFIIHYVIMCSKVYHYDEIQGESRVKKIVKYILISLLFPAISLSAKMCSDAGDVVINCPDYTVDTQIKLLFLKPSTSNLYFAAEAFPFNEAFATPGASPRWRTFDLHPTYHVAFDIGLRAVCHKHGNNL